MTPITWALLLGFLAVVVLVAELFLPSHGVLAVLGIGLALAAAGLCFYVNQTLGLIVLIAGFLAAPLVLNLVVKVWPHTPVGRRMILGPVEGQIARPSVAVGREGVAVSELRPMGVADFGDERFEVRSELGIIPAGTRVRVVSFDNNKPCVRVV